MAQRSLWRAVPASEQLEGGGFLVHRAFPAPQLPDADPFLLFDEMGPLEVAPGKAVGAPDHPHRGFETITYLLAGEMEHRDSHGNEGLLRPGDVQWMTAGSGVIHSEMPTARFQATGGRMHGFQIWVNLPRRDKMAEPRYQDVRAEHVPVGRDSASGATARVIAGEALGVRGAVRTHTPIAYVHVTLAPGGRIALAAPRAQAAFVYVFDGVGATGGKAYERGTLLAFAHDGDEIAIDNPGTAEAQALFLAGEPLREPVARYGPFVMNTTAEVQAAFDDFHSGRFASIPPKGA